MKKQMLAATIGVLTVGALLAGTTSVFAQDTANGRQSLVQRVASRFSLSESDVQSVFNEDRQERQQDMEAQLETRLNQAVTDGKLTDAQKQLILTKHQELQTQREADQADQSSKTPTERRAAMESRRTELENWATENNIDPSFMAEGQGGKMGMGGGHRGGMGEGRAE
ncbi:hypothetical protein KA012_03930 [Candidatus Woesebacteria bacterium]|nr:hypothetical protein [Candidatus Woesebacteria bacterium]